MPPQLLCLLNAFTTPALVPKTFVSGVGSLNTPTTPALVSGVECKYLHHTSIGVRSGMWIPPPHQHWYQEWDLNTYQHWCQEWDLNTSTTTALVSGVGSEYIRHTSIGFRSGIWIPPLHPHLCQEWDLNTATTLALVSGVGSEYLRFTCIGVRSGILIPLPH